ncbi:hypothetical protein SDC9_197722 [bioreactor metagenome]|uniref:Uncharacterized protein n=1 Tax=bioreactor metagenome TaxID=1076179 RepID=A0A645IGJ7_9ZZZZ
MVVDLEAAAFTQLLDAGHTLAGIPLTYEVLVQGGVEDDKLIIGGLYIKAFLGRNTDIHKVLGQLDGFAVDFHRVDFPGVQFRYHFGRVDASQGFTQQLDVFAENWACYLEVWF